MKKLLAKMDIWLLVLTIIYSILGLIMIFSASSVSTIIRYNVAQHYFFIRQAVFVVVSFLIGFIIVLRFPTKKYHLFAFLLTLTIIGILFFLIVYGKVMNNVKSWIDLGYFNIQPSEFAKSIAIIYLACSYYKLENSKNKTIYNFLFPVAICLIMVFLIFLQPDFGTALILGGIIFFIFISIPSVKHNIFKVIKIGVIALLVASLAFAYSGTSLFNAGQLQRFQFKEPCSRYTSNTGYQVCNGFIAIHNGGLFGLGLGNSTQKHLFLPESHTDFIFPIIVEELGVITGVLIIIGYMIMLYRILKIAKEAENLRLSILAYGVFLYLLFHILVNILGILALIPLTGVPLPLLSYGGSFTLNVIIMLFVVQRVNIENKTLKNRRELAQITN